MGFLELFRQKQIHITPESAVKVSYIAVQNAAELYSLAEGELLLVKRQLTSEDAAWLRSYPGDRVVFTMHPRDLEAFDAKRELERFMPVHVLEQVGLCFLHAGDALYVFDELPVEEEKPVIPNVVRLSPVHRKEIETQLSVDMDAIMAMMRGKQADGTMPEALGELPEEKSQPEREEKKEPKEIDLLRKELCELFSSRFVEVRAEFSGTSPETRTIKLSDFYIKHGIERGQLRGSWSLFEKKRLKEILDVGIANRAKEAELKGLTLSVPTYGRIIRIGDLEKLRAKMEEIERDFKGYLDGAEDCKKVGSVLVKRRFSPAEDVAESFDRLQAYLHRIGDERNADRKYHAAVDKFVDRERWKQKPFSERVKLQFTSSTYTESQWSDRAFMERFWQAMCDNPSFFEEDFKKLLERYRGLFYEEEEKKRQSQAAPPPPRDAEE